MAGFPPGKNKAFTFTVALTSQSDTDIFQANPTLAAGDVKVGIDDGALANLATLPTVIGTGKTVKVSLSAAEMNGDYISVIFSDQAGDEWQDLLIVIIPDSGALFSQNTLTESYASDGSAVTAAQALYEIMQFHNERNIAATTISVKKRDGSTEAMTYTYDGDSITRAS